MRVETLMNYRAGRAVRGLAVTCFAASAPVGRVTRPCAKFRCAHFAGSGLRPVATLL